MGRMVHYQTEEGVSSQELELLREIARGYNSHCRSSGDRIKLWKKSDILSCMTPPDAVWGFTKIRDGEELERVVGAVKRMSAAAPRLTWVLYEDGSRGRRESTIRNGEVVEMEREGA